MLKINNMDLCVGDTIKTQVGGPYKVTDVKDNLITFKMKNGVGQTITQHITKIIKHDNERNRTTS
jgi:hypothetical protein